MKYEQARGNRHCFKKTFINYTQIWTKFSMFGELNGQVLQDLFTPVS